MRLIDLLHQKRRDFRYTISWDLAMEILGFKVADVCECFLYFSEGKHILTCDCARLHARVDFNRLFCTQCL